MSLSADRAELAQILSTIDGVSGFAYRPKIMSSGNAWPLLGPLERGPADDYLATWRVVIILPTDERKASDWFANHLEDITDALDQFSYVERIEPYAVQTEGGDVNAMLLTMNKEA